MIGYQVQCDGCCRGEDWRGNSKIFLQKDAAICVYIKKLADERANGISADVYSEEEDCENCPKFKYYEDKGKKICQIEYEDVEDLTFDCPLIKTLDDCWELTETAESYYLNAKEDTDYVSICIKEVEIKE